MINIKQVLEQALEALQNGKNVRNCEGGTKFQPPLEDDAILAIQDAIVQCVDITPDELTEAFAKVYKNDAITLSIAKENKDYYLESYAARHRWAAFEAGAAAVMLRTSQQLWKTK